MYFLMASFKLHKKDNIDTNKTILVAVIKSLLKNMFNFSSLHDFHAEVVTSTKVTKKQRKLKKYIPIIHVPS